MYDVSSLSQLRAFNDLLPKMAIVRANKEKEPVSRARKHKLLESFHIEYSSMLKEIR